jgi:S-adenosylmethionine decarboxylase
MTEAAPVAVGTHVLIDVRGCTSGLDDPAPLEAMMRDAAGAAGATVLEARFHHFGLIGSEVGGVTGFLMLAESHISIHSWPERDYAALDIFMCGSARIEAAIAVIQRAFEGSDLTIRRFAR